MLVTTTSATHTPRYVGGRTRGRRSVRGRAGSDAGFSLIELLIICAIASVAMGFAVIGIGNAKMSYRARSAVSTLKEQLTTAREMAVSQQRDVKIEFIAPNRIKLTRIEKPSGTTTVRDAVLEGGMGFVRYADLNPTPDAWGGDAALAFGETAELRFRSDGALVDEENNYVNGRIFVGHGTDVSSAGFVSVFGATGRVRGYRVEGKTWVQ